MELSLLSVLLVLPDSLPTPMIVALLIFILHVLLIADAGAGAPIFFPLIRRITGPYEPTAAYRRLKSKYVP